MRVFSLRTALCLTLLSLATTTTFASVRGKPAKLKSPIAASPRVAQNEADYSVNSVPVPTDVNVINERVIQENTVPSAATNSAAMANSATNVVTTVPQPDRLSDVATPMLTLPMQSQSMQPMAIPMMMSAPGCPTCGGMSGGLSASAAAAYDQAFGPGLYRSGAEVGQNHFPYYSYRRPWYFPGQPSFHRSTDYVW